MGLESDIKIHSVPSLFSVYKGDVDPNVIGV